MTAVAPLNPAIAAVSPPSGYVRLPPVDQFHLIPYADTSSSSPSPSQYSAQTQQVHFYSTHKSYFTSNLWLNVQLTYLTNILIIWWYNVNLIHN